ncbi:hypothetical protein M9Y10_012093 [Tritrichomonas musculus]|uniref:THAP9-like helix-turn-helix domain-containing protein n=1 Tax=Tritrichomonas musculus TaxID=1915356 RepID=A0ABR2ICM7_9EUKA
MSYPPLPYLGQISKLKTQISNYKFVERVSGQRSPQQKNQTNNATPLLVELLNPKITAIFREIVEVTLKFAKGQTPQYSQNLKEFCYSVYCTSETAYRSLRKQMRLPSESCLRKTFRPKVQNIKKKISDIRFTNQMLTENFLNFNVFSSIQIIPCTLIIDAFTVSAITPYSKTKFFEKAKSNCFLYLIAPHDPNLNIFPIYLYEVENGNATTYTQNCIIDIINASKNSKFLIKYCSVDGDPDYSSRFKEHFSQIFDSIQNSEELSAIETINEIQGFHIGDFIHFLKNARSILLLRNIVINPTQIDNFIQYEDLLNDINLSHLVKDCSILAKLRDELAVSLFSLQTTFSISETQNSTTFIYFLIFSLWTESILNESYSNDTR